MEEQIIALSQLNDFVFCPASIYFHNLYGKADNRTFQKTAQVKGSISHESIDEDHYSTRKDVLVGVDVYSEEYGITGKIDIFDITNGLLTERKRTIKQVYDGYVFQLYGQYFCLEEMGYKVQSLRLYSMTDNKVYPIALPENDNVMCKKFIETIKAMKTFQLDGFRQTNIEKCRNCIYEPACDRGLI